MRKISDIYEEYKIMKNLQMHQYRVAAVAWQICESLDLPVDKKSVVTACLLHDMGNIIKFDLHYFPEFNKPEGAEYWQSIQREYINKYGQDEHHATIEIAEELGFKEGVTSLIDAIDFKYVETSNHLMSLEEKICVYADNRVNPHQIVSLHQRSEEVQTRYVNHPNKIEEESRMIFIKHLEIFENFIFEHSSITPEMINDESVAGIIEELKNFEI